MLTLDVCVSHAHSTQSTTHHLRGPDFLVGTAKWLLVAATRACICILIAPGHLKTTCGDVQPCAPFGVQVEYLGTSDRPVS